VAAAPAASSPAANADPLAGLAAPAAPSSGDARAGHLPQSGDPLAGLLPPDDTLQRAQDAYVHGEYDEAIALAKRAKAQDSQKAWRIIGASSCFKKDAAAAAAAWNELDGRGKKFVEYVCKRNDVTLPNGAPVL
ncbi:MAG TPA: hypothetical protein VF945_20200, partial [Polyangia bacterium]